MQVRVKLGSSILDGYSHWIPSMGRPVADGWTRLWARRPTSDLSLPLRAARVGAQAAGETWAGCIVSLTTPTRSSRKASR